MLLRRRPDWSRRLPQPFTIPEVAELRTLGDVRDWNESSCRMCSDYLCFGNCYVG
jgi:hypothetical protein